MSPWMKARGDMRKRISRGERARGPVMILFDTTVCRFSVSTIPSPYPISVRILSTNHHQSKTEGKRRNTYFDSSKHNPK